MAACGGSERALFVHWNHWNIRLVSANKKLRLVQARSGERAELPCALGSAQTCCVASTRHCSPPGEVPPAVHGGHGQRAASLGICGHTFKLCKVLCGWQALGSEQVNVR